MSRPLVANRETKNEESAWSARLKRRAGGKCQLLRSDKQYRVWCARVKIYGKNVWLGQFPTAEQAGSVASEWRIKNMPGAAS